VTDPVNLAEEITSMLRPIDEWFLHHDEPAKSCLQFLRRHILQVDDQITETWKYGMPFYYYKEKRVCYLWVHKKYQQPYIGLVEGKRLRYPGLLTEKRARMKILLIDPVKNIPVKTINAVLIEAIKLYK
jgi:hypothetical protein